MYNFSFLFFITLNLFSQDSIDLKFKNTGSNMTVAILEINDTLVNVGDTLAVFYDLPNNKSGCGGFVIWNNDKVALTIWGNDNTSIEKDGFAVNEEFLPIYHIKNGFKRKIMNPKFLVGSRKFSHNGISVIKSLN